MLAERCRWLDAADREALFQSVALERERDALTTPPHEFRRQLIDTALHEALDQGKRAWRLHSTALTAPATGAAHPGRAPDGDPSVGFAASLRHRPAAMCAAACALACGGAACMSAAPVGSAIPNVLHGADSPHAGRATAPPSTAEREQHARAEAARTRHRQANRARRAARRTEASAASHRSAQPSPALSLEIAARPAPADGEFGLESQPAPARHARPTPEELEFGLEHATP